MSCILTTDAHGSRPLSLGVKQVIGRGPLLNRIYAWIGVVGLAFISYFLVSHCILQTVQVVGVSMVPTLQNSQTLLLNRWIYYFRAPRRNELVVLRDPVDKGFAVKRVIAVGGDHLLLKDGLVYVNGQKLAEPYLASGMPTFPESWRIQQSITLSQGEYFVLGDNRKNSADSRSYGPVSRERILGLIMR